MANPKLLLVDADPRSIRVLGVSLRLSGYRVTTSGDAVDALAKAESIAPDFVLCDTRLPQTDAYSLVRAFRSRPESARIPVILLSSKESAEERKRGLDLGVEDYLTKPVVVGELLARIHLVLARRLRENIAAEPPPGGGRTRFSGSTQELPMVDLLQTFDATGRSGVVHLRSGVQEADLYFRDGKVVDAELGRLRGEEAVYRVLMWDDASFDIELKSITLENVVGGSTEEILMEGMRRLDAWGLLRERLQPVASLFEVDHAQVLEQLNGVVRLLDVKQPTSDARPDRPFELSALSNITRGLLVPGPEAGPRPEEGNRLPADTRASEPTPVAAAFASSVEAPVARAVEPSSQVSAPQSESEDREEERKSGHAPSAPFFGDVALADHGAQQGTSLLPTTREVEPREQAFDDDMAAAGVPHTQSHRRRFATVTIAAAALAAALLAPAALRTLRGLQWDGGSDARLASARAALSAPSDLPATQPAIPAVPAAPENVAPPAEVAPAKAVVEGAGAPLTGTEPAPPSLPSVVAPGGGLAASLAGLPDGRVMREKALDTKPTAGGQSPAVLAAEQALMQGKTEQGLALARQASIDNPADAEAWLTLAAANEASGNAAGAREAYVKCVSQAHTASVMHCRVLGRVLASK